MRAPYSAEEDDIIRDGRLRAQPESYKEIVKRIFQKTGVRRTEDSAARRWHAIKPARSQWPQDVPYEVALSPKSWAQAEMNKLRQLVEDAEGPGAIDWKEISVGLKASGYERTAKAAQLKWKRQQKQSSAESSAFEEEETEEEHEELLSPRKRIRKDTPFGDTSNPGKGKKRALSPAESILWPLRPSHSTSPPPTFFPSRDSPAGVSPSTSEAVGLGSAAFQSMMSLPPGYQPSLLSDLLKSFSNFTQYNSEFYAAELQAKAHSLADQLVSNPLAFRSMEEEFEHVHSEKKDGKRAVAKDLIKVIQDWAEE